MSRNWRREPTAFERMAANMSFHGDPTPKFEWTCANCGKTLVATSLMERGKLITEHFDENCSEPKEQTDE